MLNKNKLLGLNLVTPKNSNSYCSIEKKVSFSLKSYEGKRNIVRNKNNANFIKRKSISSYH